MADCPSGNCSVRVLTREQKRQEFEYDLSNPRETWQDFRWRMLNLSEGYLQGDWDMPMVEEFLHDLWDELIHVAKRHPADSAEHDRLVTLILEARECGPITRKKTNAPADEEPEPVILPNGQRLWSDLPHLVQEFQDAWMKESMGYTAAQREGLAALTARLCALGVFPSELGRCALWLFKETFETERPLSRAEGEVDATNGAVPVVELLPACLAWLKYNSFNLAKFTATNHDYPAPSMGDDVPASTTPGDLAPKSEFPCSGFSIPRWVFWRRRYKHFYHCGNEQVAKLARACFEEAVFKGTRMGIELPGEKVFLVRIFEALDMELAARGMQGSVNPEEIEIDMDWAED
ncbi:hypothetical protein ANOM_002808 [Aspergillus nomiae NRRL 13137]|uniref:Uncharacterized protein n=1 Tax=Aspergillus nomiae NRRL (strain ATCC 15546 / NRRL 13137 / CBS 260.88 / M93) TaxID=1509407 RepID=A0A0L1JAK4_ASPN3|nr:uncharacterized protein ANOM_002808 [Aspergillus nomiae NRRL 13137]KNG88752.1 hypothetical protein ANOM_002808 [Aspergillus nomiae NRRL 13137]